MTTAHLSHKLAWADLSHLEQAMRRSQTRKTERSRALRSQSSSAEDIVWSHLRGRGLGGYKFVRQAPVGPYFADFLCREYRVVFEIDGATHSEPHEIASDAARSLVIEKLGSRIFRAGNGDVYENIDGVLDHLLAFLEGETD